MSATDPHMDDFTLLRDQLASGNVTLVAVSKIQPIQKIQRLYELGQRDFGENYVQELVEKAAILPADIRWHFIGHLQSNKVKQVLPACYMIQGVDSLRLLKEIDKQAGKAGKKITCLLQVFIAREETKFGLDEEELALIMQQQQSFTNVSIGGLMGMASFSDDGEKVGTEFARLKQLFDLYRERFSGEQAPVLSMGMSGDYQLAIQNGSNMVRIGSLLFGARQNKS
ncbi:MAG: YggS family pyridoxal phosphate-dependent enzyme [Chitinophagaceae bacterium]|nr:MAG: YggS family pyridoxal phosphate-dependent enzyme [Chitinophagaceae bacterium]